MSTESMSTVDQQLVRAVARSVGEQLTEQSGPGWSDDDRRMFARNLVNQAISRENELRLSRGEPPLTGHDVTTFSNAVINSMFGLGRLQVHIDNPDVTDIYVNGFDNVHLKWRDGRVSTEAPIADSDEDLIEMIRAQARRTRHEHQWDPASPVLDMQLPSGDRLNAVAWVAMRPSISIRRHDFAISRLKELVDRGTINEALHQLLRAMVKAQFNILVAGGTGAGKTTLLRCLINEIPSRGTSGHHRRLAGDRGQPVRRSASQQRGDGGPPGQRRRLG